MLGIFWKTARSQFFGKYRMSLIFLTKGSCILNILWMTVKEKFKADQNYWIYELMTINLVKGNGNLATSCENIVSCSRPELDWWVNKHMAVLSKNMWLETELNQCRWKRLSECFEQPTDQNLSQQIEYKLWLKNRHIIRRKPKFPWARF